MKFKLSAFSFQLSACRTFLREVARRFLRFLPVRRPTRRKLCAGGSLGAGGKADSRQLTAGFTLIELLVVVAILGAVSTLMFANNSRFGGTVLLENLAYEIGLSVRKAQVFGIAVQRFGEAGFSAGYGIHFNIAMPTNYVLFADIYPSGTGNGLFDIEHGELVESTAIQRGNRIVDLCATVALSGTETCGLDSLDIMFKRPEPDAFISKNGVSGALNPSALQEQGRIILESPRGDRTSVVVEITGQIAVQRI